MAWALPLTEAALRNAGQYNACTFESPNPDNTPAGYVYVCQKVLVAQFFGVDLCCLRKGMDVKLAQDVVDEIARNLRGKGKNGTVQGSVDGTVQGSVDGTVQVSVDGAASKQTGTEPQHVETS